MVPVTHVLPALGTLPLLHSAHKTRSVPSKRQNLHPFKKREKLVCPAWAGQEKGFERVNLGLEHDCGQTHSIRTTRLDGCKDHPSAGARAPLQAPSRMLPASTGLQIPTLGKAKKKPRAPQPAISPCQDTMATHTHLSFLSPCVFCILLASVGRQAQEPHHQHQGALLCPPCSGHCHQCDNVAVFV